MALSERALASYAARTAERKNRRKAQWEADRDAHLTATNHKCEIGPLLAAHGLLAYRWCTGRATTCHHAKPRGMGGSGDNSELLSACPQCHDYVEANPAEAELIGAKIRHDT